ncbi:DUF3373 family protein [Candidatus Sulfurimonas baltica]|uniref:DUF3373 family protein n=1 Tax=Candidatus Sulfurimonas baltica TaxID=2740404 RepID=A0A7S7RN99_9BACT|nr:DUF3373 family protein [Candidatus Sulfurimonas baltica]QOY52215.1 DUF3373 family protein [Candidatus Sulfurimonas baltica]
MKKVMKLSLAASILALAMNANASDDINSKIDSLQKQINELKNSQLDVNDELEERIDEVETLTMTDKIQFGLDFRTQMNNFDAKDATGKSSKDNNLWTNRLRLNLSSQMTDDMKFKARLSMYKNWAGDGVGNINTMSNVDMIQGRRPNDSTLFVERAYVDWTAIKGDIPVTFTIGRGPTSDGPSHQYKDNGVRKATYSALSFDAIADSIVATLNLQKVSGVNGMSLRLAYGKGSQDSQPGSYVGNHLGDAMEDMNYYGTFFETGLGMEGSLLQLSTLLTKDVVAMTPGNASIGDLQLSTAMLEFTNIKSTGIDFFAHYAVSKVKPNGAYGLMDPKSPISMTNPPMGFLTNTPGDTSTKSGNAFWVGTRYTMPFESMNNPRIGIEYNKGSKNWFNFTQASNSLTNKLAARGDAIEVYYIQPINRFAHIRIGAEMIDYDYTMSGFQVGAPMSMSQANQAATMMGVTGFQMGAIDKLSNYYLVFNVTY